MNLKPLALVLCSLLLTACNHLPRPNMPGSDRDAHGCIGSAGYSWCPRTQRCERPWELAKKAGFANTPEAFHRYCTQPGNTK